MKSSMMLALALTLGLAAACGGSSNNPPANPQPPAIGSMQIDRLGRAGVNTALTDPFDINPTMTQAQVKDAYNAPTDPSTWGASFTTEIAGNLAILDALDGVCGNQLGADTTKTDNPGQYGFLAGVLADDRLFLNTASATCQLYLGVEADATGLAKGNGDCGGRTPVEGTIQETYQLLVAGTPCLKGTEAVCAINDGIPNMDAEGGANATTFPFLGNPN